MRHLANTVKQLTKVAMSGTSVTELRWAILLLISYLLMKCADLPARDMRAGQSDHVRHVISCWTVIGRRRYRTAMQDLQSTSRSTTLPSDLRRTADTA